MLLQEIGRLRRTLPAPTSPRFQRPSSGDNRPSSQQIHRTARPRRILRIRSVCWRPHLRMPATRQSTHFRRNGNVAVLVHRRRALTSDWSASMRYLSSIAIGLHIQHTGVCVCTRDKHATTWHMHRTSRGLSSMCAQRPRHAAALHRHPYCRTAATSSSSRSCKVSLDAPAPHGIGGNNDGLPHRRCGPSSLSMQDSPLPSE